jgi:hypothetical protein
MGVEKFRRGGRNGRAVMSVCDACGNASDRMFTVQTSDDRVFTFDSVQCAAPYISPNCAECACDILGHGIEVGPFIYCCSGCARRAGLRALPDNVPDVAG